MAAGVPTRLGLCVCTVSAVQLMPVGVLIASAVSMHLNSGHTGAAE